MLFYFGKNAYSCFAYFFHAKIDRNTCVAAIGAMRFSVRGFGCALFYFLSLKGDIIKKQIFKKLTAMLLVLAMLPVFSLFVAAEDDVVSSLWGNLSWTLNKTTGLLTISGWGTMNGFSYDSSNAWRAYKSSIKSVVIEESVTSIGSYAFYDCTSLTKMIYCGTEEEWGAVSKGNYWNNNATATVQFHNFENGVVTTAPTHTVVGVKAYTCLDCGETKTEDIPKTTAHSYGAWQKHTAEQHKRVCECGHTITLGHKWATGEITTPATHTTSGVIVFSCTLCGETRTQVMGTVGEHTYTEYQQSDSETHQKICSCGDAVMEAHAFGEWKMLDPAAHQRVCPCGQSVTEKHVFGEWQSVDGHTHKRTCACGAEETQAHEWVDGICNGCGVSQSKENETTTLVDETRPLPNLMPSLGCGSSVVSPWSVIVLVAILPLMFFRKKKENE